jgi:hypothetical protein
MSFKTWFGGFVLTVALGACGPELAAPDPVASLEAEVGSNGDLGNGDEEAPCAHVGYAAAARSPVQTCNGCHNSDVNLPGAAPQGDDLLAAMARPPALTNGRPDCAQCHAAVF